ncbi:MAG: HIT family protein [Planctomycetes bacterium]|nr:HIT family protein [Planctomycetota bacterium]
MTTPAGPCPLCSADGGLVLWRDAALRVVLAGEPEWPGFCRVIWREHVAELTDLADDDRARVMRAVSATEAALRTLLAPDKINLASLGNLVPHLHWHVIPRWRDDSRFPAPIWAPALREAAPRVVPADFESRLIREIRGRLGPERDAPRPMA